MTPLVLCLLTGGEAGVPHICPPSLNFPPHLEWWVSRPGMPVPCCPGPALCKEPEMSVLEPLKCFVAKVLLGEMKLRFELDKTVDLPC